jgi:anti-sigma factor RsiW
MNEEGEAMTTRDSPVTEDELHAYVDGELPADRREAVTAWLAEHPDEAALVAAWRAQADAIRARYGAIANEAVPERLQLDRVIRNGSASRRSWIAIAAAAATVAFMVGGAAGWLARGASAAAPTSLGTITADALEAHELYVVEVRHPVEVPGNERVHMTKWLSKRLGHEQRVPDLDGIGLKLVGGRLLPGPSGAAAFYMYESGSGERFTLYCSKLAAPETALRFEAGKQFAAFTWVEDDVGYVVSGPRGRDRLEEVTTRIYEQLDRTAGRKS